MQAIVFSPPTSQQITNSKAIAMLLVWWDMRQVCTRP